MPEMPDKLTLLVEGHRRMKARPADSGNLQATADQVHPGRPRLSTPEGDAAAPQRGHVAGWPRLLGCVADTPTDRLQLGLPAQDADLGQGVLERPVINRADQ